MPDGGGRRRVLVADDDALVRWALCSRLSDLGMDALQAGTVREALEREAEADLVLIDVRLPDGDGVSAAREMVSRRPGRPLFVMTAFATPELAVAATRAGARRFIEKPFDMDAVVRVVAESFAD